ncbi:MAG: ParB N-terminal domain-containing protein [Chloroflexota bacterium]|nr:ParB N-terminal domain-containing protein [Chloroflexota bacterium]
METEHQVRVEDITIDPTLQPRVEGIDPDHVRTLEASRETWPPLIVVALDGQHVLVDGFHRYAAAQNLGLDAVPVEIRTPPPDGDLKALAFALNAVHGRPLSLADRRAEAERLLREWPVVSNLEVSRRAGLAPTTIATIRARLEEAAAIEAAPERIGADGTRYPVSTARSLRAPGVLPDEGLGERLSGAVGRVFTSEERRQQRQVASYFKRLAVALEDGDDLPGWETAPDAAGACRLVLGEEEAADLGERLDRTSRNVLDVAVALGYADREDAA